MSQPQMKPSRYNVVVSEETFDDMYVEATSEEEAKRIAEQIFTDMGWSTYKIHDAWQVTE